MREYNRMAIALTSCLTHPKFTALAPSSYMLAHFSHGFSTKIYIFYYYYCYICAREEHESAIIIIMIMRRVEFGPKWPLGWQEGGIYRGKMWTLMAPCGSTLYSQPCYRFLVWGTLGQSLKKKDK